MAALHKHKRRRLRNGDAHRAPAQVSGRTLRGLSNGNINERNEIAARLVRGDAKPVRLNVAQAAALASIGGVYNALHQQPAK